MAAPLRPQFEPLPDADPRRPGPPRLLSWLRLMRLPNVFTAIADVAMGYLFVIGSIQSPMMLMTLFAASACLYIAGMILNDVFDYEIDTRERPFRPLPSGQIALPAARTAGFALLAAGVVFGWLAGYLASGAGPQWRSGVVATILAGCVLAYDGFLKSTPIGPLAMGACRFFNVLLGMSAAPAASGWAPLGYGQPELLAAAGIGLYIVGVTWFSRTEAAASRRGSLLAAVATMAAGVVVLGTSAACLPPGRLYRPMGTGLYWVLLFLLLVPVVRRSLAAVLDPQPPNVQAAVKHGILSLIWLDAATSAAVAGPLAGIAVATLLIPALVLGRWLYST